MKRFKKIWLKIWNKIKCLFGKRKMEIEKTVNKWFDDTAAQMKTHFKTDSQIDMLCASALKVGKNYCNAVLLLLKNGHKMPAKALLRILCELTAKLTWCLWVSDKKEEADDIVYEKFQRWQKATLVENKKMLESLREAMPDDQKPQLDNNIETLEKRAKDIEFDAMPKVIAIFKELPKNWKTDIYPVCYKQFNNAVHLDMQSMGELIEKNENKIFCLGDSKDNIDDLAGYCLDWTYHINYFIRMHYDWSIGQMEKEYNAISKQ